MDRSGKNPFDLLHEIEKVLGIVAVPWNWPIGLGPEFCGVHDREHGRTLLFQAPAPGSQPLERGSLQVPTRVVPLPELADVVNADLANRCRASLDLLDGATERLDQEQYLQGKMTPVFFGSAMTNFGVEPFLEAFLRLAPAPRPRQSNLGPVPPDRADFAGMVFKIQANLNPRHRDRVAFVRVCAGRFTPETELKVARTDARLRIKGSHSVFAQERAELIEALPGDIIGLAVTGDLRLGDTLFEGTPLHLEGVPQFSPECFAVARRSDTARRKQFGEGLQHLADEGAVQVFTNPDNLREPILAAVGELQFDVVKSRLESEYGVASELAVLPYKAAAWAFGPAPNARIHGALKVFDHRGRLALLSQDTWSLRWLQAQYPELKLRAFSEDLFVPEN